MFGVAVGAAGLGLAEETGGTVVGPALAFLGTVVGTGVTRPVGVALGRPGVTVGR